MTDPHVPNAEKDEESRLPKRDFFLLPLLSIFTIVFLFCASELTARVLYAVNGGDSCRVEDAKIAFRYRPLCSADLKTAEGPWVVNKYNECGYRTNESCGTKPVGAFRIALIGASLAEGFYVNYNDIFAVRMAKELSQKWGRPVEVQNLGREECYPLCVYHRVDESIALKPDLVIFALSVNDLMNVSPDDLANRDKPMPRIFNVAPKKEGFVAEARGSVQHSRAMTLVLHDFYQDPSTYLRLYSLHGSGEDYMQPVVSSLWKGRLQTFDGLLGDMAEKYKAAHIPFMLVVVPSVAQASAVALQELPANMDPYLFDKRMEAIASRHGIEFVDTLDTFKRTPGSNSYFYMVDGHLDARGNALISEAVVKYLATKSSPPPSSSAAPRTANKSL